MADGQTNGTQTPNPAPAPAAAAPAGGTFAPPAGQRLVSEQDYATFQRWGEQAKGAEGLLKRFKDAGFEKPDEFDKYAPKFRALKEKGYTPEALDILLDPRAGYGEPEEKPAKGAEFDQAKIDEIVDKAVNQRLGKHEAYQAHKSAMSKTPDRLTAAAKEILGEDAGEFDIELWSEAIKSKLQPEFYPEGHPLRNDEYAPPSDEAIKTVVAALKQKSEAHKASALANKGTAVRRSVASPASPNTGQGKPEQRSTRRPDGRPTPESIEAQWAERAARRG